MSLISGIVIVASGNSFHSVYIQLTHMELPARKPKQVDTSSLSEMEIIRDISYLKRHKVPGPDGQSPSFFKDDGEV